MINPGFLKKIVNQKKQVNSYMCVCMYVLAVYCAVAEVPPFFVPGLFHLCFI